MNDTFVHACAWVALVSAGINLLLEVIRSENASDRVITVIMTPVPVVIAIRALGWW